MTIEAVQVPPVPGHPTRWEIRGVNNMPPFTISETDLGDGLRALCNAFNSAQLRFELEAKRNAGSCEQNLQLERIKCSALESKILDHDQVVASLTMQAAFDQSRVCRMAAEIEDLKGRIYGAVLDSELSLATAKRIVFGERDEDEPGDD